MTIHLRGAWTKGLLGVLVIGTIISLGAGQLGGVYRTELTGFVLPATQLVNLDGSVMRLDTRTGAVYRLRGVENDASRRLRRAQNDPAPQARINWVSNWRLRVPAVKEAHSGKLQIQEWPLPYDGTSDPKFGVTAWKRDIRITFLVDIITGKTWYLQERASSNFGWVPIKDFP